MKITVGTNIKETLSASLAIDAFPFFTIKGFPSTMYLPSPSRTVTSASPGELHKNRKSWQNNLDFRFF